MVPPADTPQTTIQNTGSGAIATQGGVSADASGVVVGGNVEGGIHIHSQPVAEISPSALRDAYLRRIMERCGYLSLTGIDPAAANQRDTESGIRLDAVYTALLTRTLSERPNDYSGGWQQSALEQLDRHPKLVLQGDPGSGKSTFVHFVALCLAGETLKDEQANLHRLTAPLPDRKGDDAKERQPWRHGALLPVPVMLRDFATTGLPERDEVTAETLWNFIAGELKAACQADCVEWLRHELREHGGLLLLDGLDEVPEAEQRREQVKRAVEAFVQSFGNCRVLVTSHTYTYEKQRWWLQGFATATLAPFSDEQIRRFVARWYALSADLGRLPKPEAAGRAELLKRAIFTYTRDEDPEGFTQLTLRELAQRPLLLTLMTSLYAWRSGDLLEKREALYAEIVNLLLNRWEQRLIHRDDQGQYQCLQPSLAEYLGTDKKQVRAVLEALAFEAHRAQPKLADTADIAEKDLVYRLFDLHNNPDANPKRLVEFLQNRVGLLYSRGIGGVYTFLHRNFQEYLAACYLIGEDYPEQIVELARADPNRWREVALLAGAKAARSTAASLWRLVDALCFRDPTDPTAELADAWGAQIAAQALIKTANLTKVSPANQRKLARIRQWLLKLLRDERLPATERVLAGDSLAVFGDPRFDTEHWNLPAEPLFGFVEIPAGSFMMGSDKQRDRRADEDRECPQHDVTLPSYYLSRWPVTVAQFATFVRDSGHKPTSVASEDSLKGVPNHPIVWVSWYDAMAYCRWLNARLKEFTHKRLAADNALSESERRFWYGLAEGSLIISLPSEAEWEKAARGTDGRIYPWGDNRGPSGPSHTIYYRVICGRTNPVGCFPGRASPYGCEEMSGNVDEWTRSLWGQDLPKPTFVYPYDPFDGREDLKAPGNIHRVLRGGYGAFHHDMVPRSCADRDYAVDPDARYGGNGFRVVASPLIALNDENSDL